LSTHIELTGVGDLKKTLGKLYDINKREAEKIVLRAGRVVRDAIRERAPVRSGALRKSIKITRAKAGRLKETFGILVGPTRPEGAHAGVVEYGSKGIRRIKGFRMVKIGGQWRRITQTGTMRAKPFIRPGFESSQEQFMSEVKSELNKAMGEAL
jgi:HK97 gp10 family phage protein